MNTTDAEIAGKLQAIINSINENTHWAWIKDELRFILSAFDAEPPKPTGEPIAFKRPCSTCGHQGNIMDKYCGSCGIEHLNWIPKPPEGHGKNYPAEQPATRVDMKDVFQGRASQCSEMATWLDLNGFKALSCALRNVAAKLVEAKQPKPPAQMICNHAGECETKCGLKMPHPEVPSCRRIRKMVY